MILEVQEDSNGDQFLEFPPDLIKNVGWQIGDTLEWIIEDNYIILRKPTNADSSS